MKVITLGVPDEKYNFFMDIINQMDFVEIQATTGKEKTKQDLQEAFAELRQVRAGKKKAMPFEDFLKELAQDA
jgi:hypothetical protein